MKNSIVSFYYSWSDKMRRKEYEFILAISTQPHKCNKKKGGIECCAIKNCLLTNKHEQHRASCFIKRECWDIRTFHLRLRKIMSLRIVFMQQKRTKHRYAYSNRVGWLWKFMMRQTQNPLLGLTFKFISCCHDQNHNSYVIAIKSLENI